MLEQGAHASVFEIAWSFRVGDDGETASPVTRFRMNRSSLGNPATVTELTEARVPVARSGRERVRGWGGATCRVQHRRRYLVARADRARWPARSSKPVGGVTSLVGGFDSHAPSPAYEQAKIASALGAAICSPPALGCAASSSVSNQRAKRLRCLSSEARRYEAVGVEHDLDRAVAEQARHHLRVHPLAEE